MAIRFHEDGRASMGRTAYGVRGIQLREGDEVVAMEVVKPGGTLLTVTEKGYAKRTELDEYRVQAAAAWAEEPRDHRQERPVVGIAQVHENEELLVITEQGKILRTPAATSARSAAPRRACGSWISKATTASSRWRLSKAAKSGAAERRCAAPGRSDGPIRRHRIPR